MSDTPNTGFDVRQRMRVQTTENDEAVARYRRDYRHANSAIVVSFNGRHTTQGAVAKAREALEMANAAVGKHGITLLMAFAIENMSVREATAGYGGAARHWISGAYAAVLDRLREHYEQVGAEAEHRAGAQ